MHKLTVALFLVVSTTQAQHTLNFSIYPWHTVIELRQPDSGVLVRTGAGPDVSFQVAPGTYTYVASASGHCSIEKTLAVPPVSDEPVNLNPESLRLNPGLVGCSTRKVFGTPRVAVIFFATLGFLAFNRPDKALVARFFNSPKKRTIRPVRLYNLLSFNLATFLVFAVAAYGFYTRRATGFPGARLWLSVLAAAAAFSALLNLFKVGANLLFKRPLTTFWKEVAAELESKNGAVWVYSQPAYDFRVVLATSTKTEFSYLLATCRARGTFSLEDAGEKRRYVTRPLKFRKNLAKLVALLERVRYGTLATVKNLETTYVFLPHATGELGRARTAQDTFGLGDSLYICKDRSKFVDQISSSERREQKQLERLHFGRETEARAISELRDRLPQGWQLETGIVLPYPPGGDVDACLVIPQRSDVVVEIKSYRQSLKVGEQGLEKFNGDSVEKDVEQTLRNAVHYRARGLLWLPDASFKPFRHRDIIVFAGDAASLYRHLGGSPKLA